MENYIFPVLKTIIEDTEIIRGKKPPKSLLTASLRPLLCKELIAKTVLIAIPYIHILNNEL